LGKRGTACFHIIYFKMKKRKDDGVSFLDSWTNWRGEGGGTLGSSLKEERLLYESGSIVEQRRCEKRKHRSTLST